MGVMAKKQKVSPALRNSSGERPKKNYAFLFALSGESQKTVVRSRRILL
jgi:hypothetical protein